MKGESRYEYIENIYDKLTTKLVKGEYLFIYYYTNSALAGLNYSPDNLNSPNNEYTFNFVPKNSKEKALIINNFNINQIQYQFNYCKSKNPIEMFYQSRNDTSEKSITFNYNQMISINDIFDGTTKLRFESSEDFVFSYSFIDQNEELIENYTNWKDERIEINNLTINEVSIKNDSNIVSIKFNQNYINSLARYIVVLSQKNKTNSIANLSNPCYITKLVTEKEKGIKIINIYDIGEDNISVDIDLTDILSYDGEYIVSIISQELRFEKKLNFYTPFEFSGPFKEKKNEENDKKNNKKNNNKILIILISIFVPIILIIAIILIYRYIRKKDQKIDFTKQTKELSSEELLSPI